MCERKSQPRGVKERLKKRERERERKRDREREKMCVRLFVVDPGEL